MRASDRIGHDHVVAIDAAGEATLTDGTAENPPVKSPRRLQLEVAAADPAICDVHVAIETLGITIVTVSVSRSVPIHGLYDKIADIVDKNRYAANHHEIRIVNW